MMRLWAKREEQIRGVVVSTAGLYGDLQGIAGRSVWKSTGRSCRSSKDLRLTLPNDEHPCLVLAFERAQWLSFSTMGVMAANALFADGVMQAEQILTAPGFRSSAEVPRRGGTRRRNLSLIAGPGCATLANVSSPISTEAPPAVRAEGYDGAASGQRHGRGTSSASGS
jgi:hypothetical protein